MSILAADVQNTTSGAVTTSGDTNLNVYNETTSSVSQTLTPTSGSSIVSVSADPIVNEPTGATTQITTSTSAVITTGVTNLNVSNETTSPVSQISNVSSESSTSSVSAVSTVNQTTGATTQISASTNVTNLTASSKTTSSVYLTWNTTLGISSLFIVNWTDGSVSNISNLSYNVTGLTAGVKYTFRVTAIAADGQTTGATSQIYTFTNPDVVSNLIATSQKTSSVYLTWTAPPGNSYLFIVNWTGGSVNISNNFSNLSYNVTGLTAGVNYTFNVTAVAADGQTKGATRRISAFTNPDVVSNLTATSQSTSSVYLTWNAPPGNSSLFIVNWTGGSVNISNNFSNLFYTVTGLTAGGNYTFNVTAVAADNKTTGETSRISAFTNPDVVSNLTATSQTTSSVYLKWNIPPGNSNLFIVNWTDGSVSNSNNTSNLSYNVTGLTAGVNYTFSVTAVAADGQTKGETSQISAFTKPGVVTNLTVSSKTTSSVSLTWNKPPGNSFLFIVNWTGDSVNISNNTYNVTGLTAGVNYTFSVTAVAADNQTTGATSQISTFTTPGVVTNLTVSNQTTSSVSLTWNAPPGNSSLFIVNWTDGSVSNGNNTSDLYYTVTGLTAGVSYTFSVTAVTTDGQTTGAPTQKSAFTKPDVATDLSVTEITTSSLFLNWTEPIGDRSFFKVQWSNDIITLNSTTSNTSFNISDLNPGVNYTFLISAVAADNITEGGGIGLSAYTKPDTVSNLTVVNVTTSSILLSWTQSMGKISYYVIQYENTSTTINNTAESTMSNITDLTPGVQYMFRVFAVAGDNKTEGNYSCISAYTKPDVATDLSVTEITTSSLFLNWTEPIGDRSFFKVQWSNDIITLNSTTSNTSFNISDLNPGVNYTFLISAVAADNITEGGGIGLSAYTKPDTVSNLAVVNVTNSSILLSWTQSVGEIAYYVIQYEKNSTTINNTAESTMINITDLTPGVQYTFRVFAIAGDNKTEGIYSCTSAYTKPDVSRDLSVTEITTSSLFLNWNEPIGKRSFFKVQGSNGSITLNSTTSNTFFNITDLNPAVSYTFLISAIAADNITEGEVIGLSAYTKPYTVSNLTVVNVTNSSILLTWTQSMGVIPYYVIQYENNSTRIKTTAESAMINITDLTPGVQYTFRVFAVAGDNKTEGNYSCISAYTKPDVASDLSITEITTSSLFLNWTEPIGERSFFKVQWSNGSITLNSTTSNTFLNITNLNPGVSYTFLISAVAADHLKEGEAIGLSAYTKPDTVSNLTVVNVSIFSILLTWTQSMGKISYYVIQYENKSTTINNTAESTMSNITDLTPGVQYTFRVFAVAGDKNTEGNYSCISAYTKPDVACNLSVTEITTSSLFLNWTEPKGKRSFFKVQWSNDSITLNSTTSNTSFNITDLSPGVSYTFLISAVAADNITEGEVIGLSAYTKPDTVSSLAVVNVTTSSILLTWTQSMGKIFYYVIQYENNNTTINNTAESTMINITDLTPGVLYTFRVFAVAGDNKTVGKYSCTSAYT
ncbi:receptor-type tyrosine-protein phosphatase eta-like, partial [Clarias magur]